MNSRISRIIRRAGGYALLLTAMSSAAYAMLPPPPPVEPHARTPEIDAGAAASALTLLIGGAMLLRDRFRVR